MASPPSPLSRKNIASPPKRRSTIGSRAPPHPGPVENGEKEKEKENLPTHLPALEEKNLGEPTRSETETTAEEEDDGEFSPLGERRRKTFRSSVLFASPPQMEADKNSGILQDGNQAMETPANRRRRATLIEDARVSSLLQLFWTSFPPSSLDADGCLPKKEVLHLQVLICRALYPPEDFNIGRVGKIVAGDWDREMGASKQAMSKEEFCKSLFEIVDVWTENICPEEYAAFLSKLYAAVTDQEADEALKHRRTSRNGLLPVEDVSKPKADTKQRDEDSAPSSLPAVQTGFQPGSLVTVTEADNEGVTKKSKGVVVSYNNEGTYTIKFTRVSKVHEGASEETYQRSGIPADCVKRRRRGSVARPSPPPSPRRRSLSPLRKVSIGEQQDNSIPLSTPTPLTSGKKLPPMPNSPARPPRKGSILEDEAPVGDQQRPVAVAAGMRVRLRHTSITGIIASMDAEKSTCKIFLDGSAVNPNENDVQTPEPDDCVNDVPLSSLELLEIGSSKPTRRTSVQEVSAARRRWAKIRANLGRLTGRGNRNKAHMWDSETAVATMMRPVRKSGGVAVVQVGMSDAHCTPRRLSEVQTPPTPQRRRSSVGRSAARSLSPADRRRQSSGGVASKDVAMSLSLSPERNTPSRKAKDVALSLSLSPERNTLSRKAQ